MDRRRILIALGVALPLALLAAALVYRQLNRASHAPGALAHVKIIVAAATLPPGTRLESQHLRQIDWAAVGPMAGMFARPEECLGRVLITPIVENEPILDSNLAPKNSGAGLSAFIPDGMRAVSVAVNDVVGVAGFVQPGTTVDVLATAAVERPATGSMTITILEDIRVLAAGQKVEPDKQSTPQTVTVVTLLVNPEQANILALASTQARIQLALRNYGDVKKSNPPPAEQARLFAGSWVESVKTTVPPRPRAAAENVIPAPFSVEVLRGNKSETTPVPQR